jgi:hypothetical protein
LEKVTLDEFEGLMGTLQTKKISEYREAVSSGENSTSKYMTVGKTLL